MSCYGGVVLSAHSASACHQHWCYMMKHQIMSSCFRKLAVVCCRAVYKVFIKVYSSSTELNIKKPTVFGESLM